MYVFVCTKRVIAFYILVFYSCIYILFAVVCFKLKSWNAALFIFMLSCAMGQLAIIDIWFGSGVDPFFMSIYSKQIPCHLINIIPIQNEHTSTRYKTMFNAHWLSQLHNVRLARRHRDHDEVLILSVNTLIWIQGTQPPCIFAKVTKVYTTSYSWLFGHVICDQQNVPYNNAHKVKDFEVYHQLKFKW